MPTPPNPFNFIKRRGMILFMAETLIAANWKENLGELEVRAWMQEFGRQETRSKRQDIEVVICPSFPFISLFASFQPSSFQLGAQNVSEFEKGAYTGEVSARQLKSLGVKYVIVGHSERRQNFGETNEQINQKIRLCLKYGLTPIVCVSEIKQVETIKSSGHPIVVVYEPLSAISTGEIGQPDTPFHAQKMALEIKKIVGENVLSLYGGSVDSKNAGEFLKEKGINGLLVGGASLDPVEFTRIIDTLYHL